MSSVRFIAKILVVLAVVQVGFALGATKKPKRIQGSPKDAEKELTNRLKSATPEELSKGQEMAAKRLESNVARAMQALSKRSAKEIPAEVKEQAKEILAAIKGGQLTNAVFQSVPDVLVDVNARATPGQQLQTILNDVAPRAPLELKAPLQGLMDFVKANVNGVNGVLGRVINGTPNLTQGVVGQLASTLGGVNSALMGSMDSLNGVVGGLLSGGILSGGLIPSGVLPQLPGLGGLGLGGSVNAGGGGGGLGAGITGGILG